MATQEELIAEYNKAAAALTHHEAGVEKAKESRKEIARQLFEQNGKGHVYDLGDGVPMIIVASKAKTYFLTPKEKWKRGGRKKKVAVKKKIVGMQVVEEPVPEDERSEAAPKGRIIQAEATLTAKGSVGVAAEPAQEPEPAPEPEQAPVEAPSEDEDMDELAKVLADLD